MTLFLQIRKNIGILERKTVSAHKTLFTVRFTYFVACFTREFLCYQSENQNANNSAGFRRWVACDQARSQGWGQWGQFPPNPKVEPKFFEVNQAFDV